MFYFVAAGTCFIFKFLLDCFVIRFHLLWCICHLSRREEVFLTMWDLDKGTAWTSSGFRCTTDFTRRLSFSICLNFYGKSLSCSLLLITSIQTDEVKNPGITKLIIEVTSLVTANNAVETYIVWIKKIVQVYWIRNEELIKDVWMVRRKKNLHSHIAR